MLSSDKCRRWHLGHPRSSGLEDGLDTRRGDSVNGRSSVGRLGQVVVGEHSRGRVGRSRSSLEMQIVNVLSKEQWESVKTRPVCESEGVKFLTSGSGSSDDRVHTLSLPLLSRTDPSTPLEKGKELASKSTSLEKGERTKGSWRREATLAQS